MKHDKNSTSTTIYFVIVVTMLLLMILTSCSTAYNKANCTDTYEFGKKKRTCKYD